MKIIFRTDASSQIGSGHVIRCLTLAKVLKKQGADCKFISRDHNNNLIEKIKKEDFKVIILPNSIKVKSTQSTKDTNSNYSSWIGASWNEDAKQTINALNEEKKEVISESNKIFGVEKVIPTIYLVSELSRNKV